MMKVFVSVIRHFSVDDRQKHIKKSMHFHMKIHLCGEGLTAFPREVHLSIVSALECEWRQRRNCTIVKLMRKCQVLG